jgi:hypothetical protein
VEPDALITMIIGMVIIWGGLAASIAYAIRVARRRDEPGAEAAGAEEAPR